MLYIESMVSGAARSRLSSIDYLKAAAIVAVVFTHSGLFYWGDPRYDWDFFLTMFWTGFHVPSFLFVSGFLYARTAPVAAGTIGPRLLRVLIPYLVASTAAQLAGVTEARCGADHEFVSCVQDLAFDYASASSMGVYYYVILICFCIPLIWPLSRAPRWSIWAAWGACLAYTVAIDFEHTLRLSVVFTDEFIFWSLRDPFDHFQLGFFLSGWLAALFLPGLVAVRDRHPVAVTVLLAAMAATGAAMTAHWLPPFGSGTRRVLYTFGVIGLVTLSTRKWMPGRVVMLLSEGSLGIYLFHRIFQRLLDPVTSQWADLPRILGQVGFGLGGAVVVLLLGRRLLGVDRARRWLGA